MQGNEQQLGRRESRQTGNKEKGQEAIINQSCNQADRKYKKSRKSAWKGRN
jgi:hypothetical protein